MVAASVALASLLRGEFDGACARICWRWALPGWSALTAGIILGSWWAYCELGWGGWWFWDPVENASFMPWLVGTALMHSLAVTEQRASFKAWTLLLAISAFSLCLLGLSWCVPACWYRYTRLPLIRHAVCLSSPLWYW